jgi:16S rRNA processing protein RimM
MPVAMKSADRLVTLGRVGKAHGIKGWVRVHSYTDPASNIAEYAHFIAHRDGRQVEVVMDEVQTQGSHLLAHFEGYDSPESVQPLVRAELQVAITELPQLGPGEFYWHELIGLKVINLQGENLGTVARMLETGANDVLVVQPDAHSIDANERLIPYLQDTVIRQVDSDQKVIEVDWAADFLL